MCMLVSCIYTAESFIRSIQRPDGSWYGSWAVCFTYGCWFGVSALAAKGHRYGVDTVCDTRTHTHTHKHRRTLNYGGEAAHTHARVRKGRETYTLSKILA